MAEKNQLGAFSSQAVFDVTEAGANTLTFEKLETGISVYDKIGWILNRVELTGNPSALFNTTADTLTMALTMTNSITAAQLSANNPAIYMLRTFYRVDYGTAATAILRDATDVIDYSNLPGGGLLMLPNPMYFGLVGSGLAGAATMICRIFYTPLQLGDADYMNLIQARQLLIST